MTEPDSPRAGETTPEVRRRRGRPRDPQLEERALEATLAVFGERGWVGLTIDEVAARALVGKSSIYLRWKDKETLLAAALRDIQRRSTASRSRRSSDIASPPREGITSE